MSEKAQNSQNPQNPRKMALQVLLAVHQGRSLNAVLPTLNQNLEDRDKAFAQELVYSVLKWHYKTEYMLAKLLDKPLKKKDHDIQILLHLGLIQLLKMRVPDHAAINATVSLVPKKKSWAKGLVNGVLRNLCREKASNQEIFQELGEHAFSPWMYKFIKGNWPEKIGQICSSMQENPPMFLRVNQSNSSSSDYLASLGEEGVVAKAVTKTALLLESPVPVSKLPNFFQGHVSVQDVSAQYAGSLLNPKPNMKVLDACTAPGGKACHLYEICPEIDLQVLDVSQARLERVEENFARIGVKAKIHCADIRHTDDWWDGEHFDQILLDAPCSASGVVRRNPDIKIHRRPEDIAPLVELQQECLDALWQTLQPGGELLYATCSIFKAENEAQIERFLKRQKNARLVNITSEISGGIETGFGVQILPGDKINGDGFFYAKLLKSAY